VSGAEVRRGARMSDGAAEVGTLLQLGLLGPMEIRVDGALRTPSAPMARRVLAVLLTRADRTVPTELLIDELWGDRPPKSARKAVQTYIHQLRKALGGHDGAGRSRPPVHTRPHGYLFALGDARLDLLDFQELLRRGRQALASGRTGEGAALLRDGLQLWRGAALEDVPAGPALAAHITTLENLRIRALEQRIAADLALGRHHALLDEIRSLTYDHPVHEEFCAQLMTAAARCGQRGEALSGYARLRRTLSEQLGLEPSARLRELQRAVLTGQDERVPLPGRPGSPAPPAPDPRPAAVSTPFQLPAALGDFVGRRAELDRIAQAVRGGAGRPSGVRVVTVTGGPGVGKTEVALQVADRLREHFPDGQLKATLHREDGTPQHPAETLKGLLVAVGHTAGALPEHTDDLARMFRGWAAGRRFLLLLDHAADRGQVLSLLPAGAGNTVLVTSRCRLAGLPGAVTSVALRPLTPVEAKELLAQVAGADRVACEPAAADAVVAACEGLPAAVRAVGSRIATWPRRSLADFAARLRDDHQRLAELSSPHLDLRRYLVESTERLPHGAREVLVQIAGAGQQDVPVAGLARRLRRSMASVERSAELLAAFHAVEPLVRDGVYVLRMAPLLRLAFAAGEHGPEPVPASATAPGEVRARCDTRVRSARRSAHAG
jgi:DNA-binding SARP family transcriptional activator